MILVLFSLDYVVLHGDSRIGSLRCPFPVHTLSKVLGVQIPGFRAVHSCSGSLSSWLADILLQQVWQEFYYELSLNL
jgi:hypothetical protein